MLAVIVFLFGDPRTMFALRVLGALARLCPCGPADDVCTATHQEAAAVIATVAYGERDSERAAILLLGIGAHETGFRTRRQAKGGPARSWWQVEPSGRGEARRTEQERLETDSLYAAARALAVARMGMAVYACGDSRGCQQKAAELWRFIGAAEYAFAAR